MATHLARVGATIMVAAGLTFIPARQSPGQQPAATSPCAANPEYQRLAFWVGDWEVLDSAGGHYATQRVRAVLDGCAVTAEWNGPQGGNGLTVASFDARAGGWRQVYVSNQVPAPLGVQLRKSDPTYDGPGVRFIALFDPPAGTLTRSRITIMPTDDHRVLQLFENSSDGGRTWQTQFKADHRPLAGAAR